MNKKFNLKFKLIELPIHIFYIINLINTITDKMIIKITLYKIFRLFHINLLYNNIKSGIMYHTLFIRSNPLI